MRVEGAVPAGEDGGVRGVQVERPSHRHSWWSRAEEKGTFDLPLFLITSPSIAQCMGACSTKHKRILISFRGIGCGVPAGEDGGIGGVQVERPPQRHSCLRSCVSFFFSRNAKPKTWNPRPESQNMFPNYQNLTQILHSARLYKSSGLPIVTPACVSKSFRHPAPLTSNK
jgi:hypothetical protein